MFYKYENEEWYYGLIIYLPNGEMIDSDNRENNYGWIWYDESPITE